MELTRRVLPALTKLTGEEKDFLVVGDKRLKMQTSPAGMDYLDVVVPTGKQWLVTVSVSIDETDA